MFCDMHLCVSNSISPIILLLPDFKNCGVKLFRSIDILFLFYILASTILILLVWDAATPLFQIISFRLFLIPAIVAILYWNSKSSHPLIQLFRWTYPLLLSGYFYSETVFYNKLFFDNLDPKLMQIEAAIFGMQPSVEFSAFIPNLVFSELMYFGYFTFYVLIAAFTLYTFIAKPSFFKEAVFKLSISMYIFYLLFCIFPSAGPQFYFLPPDSNLPDAYFFSHVMHFIQDTAEQPTGAFPSSHVGISIIILMLSKKGAPVFYKIVWPFVVLLSLSTVYIKAHYAIDVFGGLLAAPFILYASDFLYRLPLWDKLNSSHQAV
jgi:membrane-associated phospholipid phosphatase